MTLPSPSQLLGANELYRDDRLGIYCGECSSILSQFPDECIDLTVTSPPYDNLRNYNGYLFPFEDIARQLFRVTKPGGVVVWIVGDATIKGSETGTSFRQALFFKEIGFNLHDTMIWHKNNPMPTQHHRYENSFEYMFVLSKGIPTADNVLRVAASSHGAVRLKHRARAGHKDARNNEGLYVTEQTRIRHNVWDIPIGVAKGISHAAPFPEALARDHILSWSNEDSVILDSMCGSGTTLKMALLEGRKAIGIDIS